MWLVRGIQVHEVLSQTQTHISMADFSDAVASLAVTSVRITVRNWETTSMILSHFHTSIGVGRSWLNMSLIKRSRNIWMAPNIGFWDFFGLRKCLVFLGLSPVFREGLMKQVADEWPWRTATLTPWRRRHYSATCYCSLQSLQKPCCPSQKSEKAGNLFASLILKRAKFGPNCCTVYYR